MVRPAIPLVGSGALGHALLTALSQAGDFHLTAGAEVRDDPGRVMIGPSVSQ